MDVTIIIILTDNESMDVITVTAVDSMATMKSVDAAT